MKNRKHRSKNDQLDHPPMLNRQILSQTHRIRFNISKETIACFIGEKRNCKKKTYKNTSSSKKRKPSVPKSDSNIDKVQSKKIIQVSSKKNQAQDLVQESLNTILVQIEEKGIKCAWKQAEIDGEVGQQQSDLCESNSLWSIFSVNQSFEKSYASTMNYSPNISQYMPELGSVQSYYYGYESKNYFDEGSVFLMTPQHILQDIRTTIMIRNIPNKYTIKELADQIDYHLPNTYDFLYLPCDIKNQCNVGYGFINFLSTEFLYQFYIVFQNKKWSKFRSQKICNLTYARLQGLSSLIEHFENSKVLNQKDKKYRPIIRQFAQNLTFDQISAASLTKT